MFFAGSRYEKLGTYSVTLPNGQRVSAVRLPPPNRPAVIGAFPRTDAQRLDLIADHFLGDATTTWRLCDASGNLCPDALAAHPTIPIPFKNE